MLKFPSNRRMRRADAACLKVSSTNDFPLWTHRIKRFWWHTDQHSARYARRMGRKSHDGIPADRAVSK